MRLFLYFSMIDESFDLFYCKSVDIPDFAMCFTTLFHTKDFTKDLFYFLYSIAMTVNVNEKVSQLITKF